MWSRCIRSPTVLALGICLFGCVTTPPQPARLGLKLAPAALGRSLRLQQHLSIERLGRIDEIDAALEVDEQRLDLVGLAFGQRVFALHYDGRSLQSWRHPLVPEQLRGEDVLEDLQLTLWPMDVISKALPIGWSIEEFGRRRTLRLADQPVLVIDYSGEPRWSGTIELTNLRYQYRLTIQSVSSGP
jgi:uncharacterized protein DUF3261